MDRDEIIATLKAMEPELKAQGIEHLALFGSVARGDAGPGSDVDLLFTVSEAKPPSLFDLIGACHALSDRIGRSVDFATTPIRNPFVRHTVQRDAVSVF